MGAGLQALQTRWMVEENILASENMAKEVSSGVLKKDSDRRIVTGTKGEGMEVAKRSYRTFSK